jgi:hypothetical protein
MVFAIVGMMLVSLMDTFECSLAAYVLGSERELV